MSSASESLTQLTQIVAQLRGPNGCPWDKAQSVGSINKHILEEAQEWVDAINSDEDDAIIEEAGDVFLHVIMIAQMASEDGRFNLDDIIQRLIEKLIRRHPHVFGDEVAESEADVKRIWEAAKAKEKADKH